MTWTTWALFITAGVIYLIGTYLDWKSSYVALLHRRGISERNRVTVWFFDQFGIRTGLAVKTLLIDIGVVFLTPVFLMGLGPDHRAAAIISVFWAFLGVQQWRISRKNYELVDDPRRRL